MAKNKIVKYMLILFVFLLGLTSGCGSNAHIEIPQERFPEYLKIIDVWVEKNSWENKITSNSQLAIKFQNISQYVLEDIMIYVDYLDQNNKPIGEAAIIQQDILPSNYIEVRREILGLYNRPEDIEKEWNGKFATEIVSLSLRPPK